MWDNKKCPYCGKTVRRPTMEHYFPRSIKPNEWDFMACWDCNHLKSDSIVYPGSGMFRAPIPKNLEYKFKHLWRSSGYAKYSRVYPFLIMRDRMDGVKVIPRKVAFTKEEMNFYELEDIVRAMKLFFELAARVTEIYSLLMNPLTREFIIVHQLAFEFDVPIKGIRSMKSCDVPYRGIHAWIRIAGSAGDYIWEKSVDATTSFNNIYKWCGSGSGISI